MTEPADALWRRSFPDFARSADPAIQRLVANAGYVTLPARLRAASPGSACDNYLMVATGSVSVRVLTDSGRPVVLYHVKPGESCILTTSCLLSGETFPAESITDTECGIFTVSGAEFQRAVQESPVFRRYVFAQFGDRLAAVIRRIERISSPVDRELATALLRMRTEGTPVIATTHEDLASELGTSREVVSRHLKRFESSGWLRILRGRIEIRSVEALSTVARK